MTNSPRLLSLIKICTKCLKSLPQDKQNFRYYADRDKPHSWCRKCENEYAKLYFKTEKGKEKAKAWRQRNPEKCREMERTQRRRYPERFAGYDLKKRIGITLAQKEAKLDSQGGLCAICGTDTPNTKKTWFADHCHKTKKFRGVLCGRCNSVLGYALDNPAILIRAADYLLNSRVVL